jgi:GxxExxY protein
MSDPFSYAIIGKAMEVHRELGPGVDEIFYHELLSERLRVAGVEHLLRPRGKLIHRGIVADIFEADLLFPGQGVAELKCLRGAFDSEHYLQVFCYLKYWRVPTGLLFDFAKESLLHRRLNHEPQSAAGFDFEEILADAPELDSDGELAAAISGGIGRLLVLHGLGYRDTTYRGLLAAEFNAEGLGCHVQPVATVQVNGRRLGETQCDCLVIGQRFGIQVLALRRAITAADIAILRTYMRLLELPHGLILNFGKTSLEHCWVRHSPARMETQRFGQDKDGFMEKVK